MGQIEEMGKKERRLREALIDVIDAAFDDGDLFLSEDLGEDEEIRDDIRKFQQELKESIGNG